MNKLKIVIQLTTTLGLVVVAVFLWWGRELSDAEILDPVVFNLTYQFFLMVVAGGAISWLYRELSRLREEAERDRQEFRELHADLVTAYNAYKRTKRLLRARAWRTGDNDDGIKVDLLKVDVYCALVEELNETQLLFESMVRRVNGRNELFRQVDVLYGVDRVGGLAVDISTVEKYLNKVVQEYESALRPYKETPQYLQLGALKRVSEFIAPGEESSDQRKEAIRSFHRALEKLAAVAAERY